MKLPTYVVEKPWGRNDLPAAFGVDPARRIGEVWFDAPDASLPILVKWLFTSERLSIQVHPDDAEAQRRGQPRGKEESWYVVAASPNAVLGIGTRRPLQAEELRAAVEDGSIESLMDWKPVRAGDFFHIPAGTLHAIGPGVTIVEVQQNSDLTYRLYDYGRPRELHLADALAVAEAQPYDICLSGHVQECAEQLMIDCPYFQLFHARGEAVARVASKGSGPRWIIPLLGVVHAGRESASGGECLYFPGPAVLEVSAGLTALVAFQC